MEPAVPFLPSSGGGPDPGIAATATGDGQANPSDADPLGALSWRATADGSPTLWSEAFGEAFHSTGGARQEAERKFVAPAQLDRFAPGHCLQVLDLCVGLGYNSAALLEAAQDRGLAIRWWGLELDPRPLQLALADPSFRSGWRPSSLEALEQLGASGHWRLQAPAPAAHKDRGLGQPLGTAPQDSWGRWWLGDARSQLAAVLAEARGQCDLVLHDAFSPGHCPQLWSLEFLGQLASALKPQGRLLTYCSAAAVRGSLRQAGLELASLAPSSSGRHGAGPDPGPGALPQADARAEPGPRGRPDAPEGAGTGATHPAQAWSQGTVASPQPLPPDPTGLVQPLSAMEEAHLASRAAEPYRDPTGRAEAGAILAGRQRAQASHPGISTSAWRRHWGLDRRANGPPPPAGPSNGR